MGCHGGEEERRRETRSVNQCFGAFLFVFSLGWKVGEVGRDSREEKESGGRRWGQVLRWATRVQVVTVKSTEDWMPQRSRSVSVNWEDG